MSFNTSNFDTSRGAGGFSQNNPQTPGGSAANKAQPRRPPQNVVPVAIRQINSCGDTEEFTLFGLSVQIVSIVAILHDFEVQSTKATCRLEDHTGSIAAVLWLDGDDNIIPQVKEGAYVQAFGSIRNQEGGKIIMILKMIPVDDMNIITCHLLQVITTRLEAEAMSKRQRTALNKPGAELATSMSMMATDDGACSLKAVNNKLTAVQDRIIQILLPVETQRGLHRQTIMKNFRPNQEREVNQAIDFLVAEGHIYPTLDGNQFKATTDK